MNNDGHGPTEEALWRESVMALTWVAFRHGLKARFGSVVTVVVLTLYGYLMAWWIMMSRQHGEGEDEDGTKYRHGGEWVVVALVGMAAVWLVDGYMMRRRVASRRVLMRLGVARQGVFCMGDSRQSVWVRLMCGSAVLSVTAMMLINQRVTQMVMVVSVAVVLHCLDHVVQAMVWARGGASDLMLTVARHGRLDGARRDVAGILCGGHERDAVSYLMGYVADDSVPERFLEKTCAQQATFASRQVRDLCLDHSAVLNQGRLVESMPELAQWARVMADGPLDGAGLMDMLDVKMVRASDVADLAYLATRAVPGSRDAETLDELHRAVIVAALGRRLPPTAAAATPATTITSPDTI